MSAMLAYLKSRLWIVEAVAIVTAAAWALAWHHGKVEAIRADERQKIHQEMQPALDAMSSAVDAAQLRQASAEAEARKAREQLLANTARSTAGIDASLHHIEDSVRAWGLPCAVDDSGRSGGGSSSASCVGEIADGFRAFRGALAEATQACQHDSVELGTILDIARSNGAIR